MPPVNPSPIGWPAHRQAVARLTESYRAIPPQITVRLRKSTSNLFRHRETAATGLDVAGLTGVIEVDPSSRTAQVQGMCTYETLVDATLPYGLMPGVVPQLRTITLGGAVTGLGVESTSFRNGLPHESVLEMDILTGSGELVTTSRTQHPDLFHGFANSYGSLGYATRLQIELEPIGSYVTTKNLRFHSLGACLNTMSQICETRSYDGTVVDALDGVVFHRDETYLILATFNAEPGPTSDYTGQQIYYRSLQERQTDRLTAHDYLWRWDTDWFWCSKAFGVQQPIIRRLWPKHLRRSDTYHRIVGWELRHGLFARLDRLRGFPAGERVIQDVEIPLEATEEFLDWFIDHVPLRPIWLCPIRLREATTENDRPWPLYPMLAGEQYVNVGFWGTVPITPGRREGEVNREIEREVDRLGGHKSLYSDAYYDRETFAKLYGETMYRELRRAYDPAGRLTELYDKAVQR